MKSVASLFSTAFWTLAVALPLLALFARASARLDLLADPVNLAIVRATLWQAGWSTLLSAAIGLPLGLWIGRTLWGGVGELGQFWLAFPFGVPTVVAATAWVQWLGRNGILSRWGWDLDLAYSLQAVILAHVFFNAPWIALIVSQGRQRVPPGELEAAETMGARRGQKFAVIVWPRVGLRFASACAQVFTLSALSFAIVMILGGGPPVQTLETAIYSRVRMGALDLEGAMACALWQLGIAALPWVAVLWVRLRWVAPPEQGEREPRPSPPGTISRWLALGVCFLFTAPYGVIFSQGLGMPASELLAATFFSLRIAVLSGLLSCAVALATLVALRGSRWEAWGASLVALPSGVSVLVLGLGFWLAYGRWIDPFAGSLTAVVSLQAAIFAPVAFRMLWPVAQGGSGSLRDAAESLGAGPVRVFLTVDWARWKGPLLLAFGMIAAASIGEVAAVSFFSDGARVPLPLLASRLMGQYRFDEARVVSAWLLASAGLLLALVLASGKGGIFDARAHR